MVRRGRCGQDFLEKGDPGVWGREVTLGLKPGCCQTHNSRETQHRSTTHVRHNTDPQHDSGHNAGTQINIPHSPTLEPRQMSPTCHAGLARLRVHSYRDKGLPGTQQTCDPGWHAWLHTGNSTDTPRHRQTNTSRELMDTQDVSGWGTQIQPRTPHTDNGVPQTHDTNKLMWAHTEAALTWGPDPPAKSRVQHWGTPKLT